MCIILYKPIDKNLPNESILKNCFQKNPDGAGYMIPINNQVIIRKGFMTFESLIEDLDFVFNHYNIDVVKTPIVIHFRITTQGGVKPALTHPFPIANNYTDMRALTHNCDIALAHNGVIHLTSSYNRNLDFNDTMTFIKDYARLIIDNDLFFAKNKNKCQLLENLIGGSRLAIMNKYGYVKLIGNFIEKDGIYYSNDSIFYQPKQELRFRTFKKFWFEEE